MLNTHWLSSCCRSLIAFESHVSRMGGWSGGWLEVMGSTLFTFCSRVVRNRQPIDAVNHGLPPRMEEDPWRYPVNTAAPGSK